MNAHIRILPKALAPLLGLLMLSSPMAAAATFDPARIVALTGATGTFEASGSAVTVMIPHGDLVVGDGATGMAPTSGFTSKVTFERHGTDAQVTGDLVLLPGQLHPVMRTALRGGLEVTGLYSQAYLGPARVSTMHVFGSGDPDVLARAVGRVVSVLRSSAGAEPPSVPSQPSSTTLDRRSLGSTVGGRGVSIGDVVQVDLGRNAAVSGSASFSGSDEQAWVDGDLSVPKPRLQTVLGALTASGIDVVAIGPDQSDAGSRVVLRFWGRGRAQNLAAGIRAAVDRGRA
jgi:hypothetical protein